MEASGGFSKVIAGLLDKQLVLVVLIENSGRQKALYCSEET